MKLLRILAFVILLTVCGTLWVFFNKPLFLEQKSGEDNDAALNDISSNSVALGEAFLLRNDIDDYCKVVELEPTNNRRYMFQILNENGDVLFEDTTFRLPPDCSFIDENIIRIRIFAGTGVYFEKFYDIKNKKLSGYFDTPYTTFKRMVASIHYIPEAMESYLIVQDMFDQDKVYLYENIDLSKGAVPVSSVIDMKFIDGDKIWIKYTSGENKILIEKTYQLVVNKA